MAARPRRGTSDATIPPHDKAAEADLLKSMFDDSGIACDALRRLKPEHLYVLGHQEIFKAIGKLNGEASPCTVAAFLERNGMLADAGGPEYLAELADGASSSPTIYLRFIKIIQEKA